MSRFTTDVRRIDLISLWMLAALLGCVSRTGMALAAGVANATARPGLNQAQEPVTQPFPYRDLGIALGVGIGVALLIYGFWLLVKPRDPRR